MVLPIIPKMNKANVVIDTNVLVSALRSNRGASFKLLMSLEEAALTPCISVPLFVEYESVLKRSGLIGLTNQDIDDVLDYLLSISRQTSIFFLWRPYLKDPKDDMVLEAAVESQSTRIITYNLRDFAKIHNFGIEAITPKSILEQRGII